MELLIDGHHGQYVPQIFARLMPAANGLEEDFEILLEGPENPGYWDTWAWVLDNWTSAAEEALWQSPEGDVFLLDPGEEPPEEW